MLSQHVHDQGLVRRMAVIVLAAVALVALWASSASAVAPPAGPMTIVSTDFSAATGPYSLKPINIAGSPPSKAYWGRRADTAAFGVKSPSLWCAASGSWWPTYPAFTSGEATFALSATADYYSSRLDFLYIMPTVGYGDLDKSFVVRWSGASSDSFNDLPLTTGWSAVSLDLSKAGSPANLSRRAGELRFLFVDIYQRNVPAGKSGTGRGPAIDDVRVSGYKYGQVRDLRSSVSSGTVTLSWRTPVASVGSTATESRPVSYRVWRTLDALPYTWTEVTSARHTTTTFRDKPASGKSYRYFVQVWDQGAGMGYGAGNPAVNNVRVQIGSTYQPPPAPTVTRISGSSHSATSVEVSKRTFASAPAVVLANAGAWPDALPASALAGTIGGPLLMIDPVAGQAKSASSSVMNEIKRLKATTVYICGGTGVVTDAVRSQLQSAGLTVVRKGGTDRFNTARLVSDFIQDKRGKGGTAFISYGYSVSDALSASSIAAKMKAPVLLTKMGYMPNQTLVALNYIRPTRIVICGGTGVVSSAVQTKLKGLTWHPAVVRQSGASRYDTSKALAVYAAKTASSGGLGLGAPKKVYVGTSPNYADTLAGGVLAGLGNGSWSPVILTAPTGLPIASRDYIKATTSLHDGVILGSTSAVSDTVKSQVLSRLH